MKTKVKYAVDLNIPRPHEIQVDGESPTLAELKEYRSVWLREAEEAGRVEDIFKIAQALCTPGKPYPYSTRTPPLHYRKGETAILYYPDQRVSGPNQVYLEEYHQVIITLGGKEYLELIDGKQVVNIFKAKATYRAPLFMPEAPAEAKVKTEKNLYVPGPWQSVLSGLAGKADDIHIKANKMKAKQERAELIDVLLGGRI